MARRSANDRTGNTAIVDTNPKSLAFDRRALRRFRNLSKHIHSEQASEKKINRHVEAQRDNITMIN